MLDLWPKNIDTPKVKAPVTILREQALLLGEKTNNLVEAKVKNFTRQDKSQFEYELLLAAKAIGYSYRILTILYSIDLYPVTFLVDTDIKKELDEKGVAKDYSEDGERSFTVATESEFLDFLGKVLKSEKTIRVIHALLSQQVNDGRSEHDDIPF